jgi:hypothetical protein
LKKQLAIFLVVIVFPVMLTAQTKTNLEKFFQLIDNSMLHISKGVDKATVIALSVNGPASLELLKPKVTESFSSNGFKIGNDNITGAAKLMYSLNQTSVEYGEAEKDGFFGEIICERKISLKGIVTIDFTDTQVKSFVINESIKDTIKVDEIKNLEDPTITFTQGVRPEIPFLSNLLEPVLVVGTLITTIILLFTVRGK